MHISNHFSPQFLTDFLKYSLELFINYYYARINKNGKVENCRNIADIWILDESVAGMIDDFFIDERAVEKANSCGDCGSKDAEGHCPHVWF